MLILYVKTNKSWLWTQKDVQKGRKCMFCENHLAVWNLQWHEYIFSAAVLVFKCFVWLVWGFFKECGEVSLCSPSWPRTPFADQASLQFTEARLPLPPTAGIKVLCHKTWKIFRIFLSMPKVHSISHSQPCSDSKRHSCPDFHRQGSFVLILYKREVISNVSILVPDLLSSIMLKCSHVDQVSLCCLAE